jgi:hypothetical protein
VSYILINEAGGNRIRLGREKDLGSANTLAPRQVHGCTNSHEWIECAGVGIDKNSPPRLEEGLREKALYF